MVPFQLPTRHKGPSYILFIYNEQCSETLLLPLIDDDDDELISDFKHSDCSAFM